MLQVSNLREKKDVIIAALAKRNKDYRQHIEKILSLDDHRKHSQSKLDDAQAEINRISREVG